jgi:hypothetical protein
MARKSRNAELVAWSTLKVKALRVESAASLNALKAKVEALAGHSAIDESAYRELSALIESIERDIDSACTDSSDAPG